METTATAAGRGLGRASPGSGCPSGQGRPPRCLGTSVLAGLLGLSLLSSGAARGWAGSIAQRQHALNEWRNLTAPAASPPRVFVKGDTILFYFPTATGVEAFSANWHRVRIPTPNYKVNYAVLRWDEKLPHMPPSARGWREAVVIAGAEWRSLATNLIAQLTPPTPGHGAYYQAFLAGGVLYRDPQGNPRFAAGGEPAGNVEIEHRFSTDETLDILARLVDEHLGRSHPGGMLFLLMAPDANRVTQPLLLDRQRRRCFWLAPAALYDNTERGLSLAVTAQGLNVFFLQSHGLALLKNPVSSAARLADLSVETLARILRIPFSRPGKRAAAPLTQAPGMDLARWEDWLDRYTGTRREEGSMRLLIDGDRFFNRLDQAIANATNHINFEIYIFDKDDVSVALADQLKERSRQIPVKVIMDAMGSIAAGIHPPATPLPQDFVAPRSMLGYLRKDSRVQARPFLNPWFSADHSKVLLIDGACAWLGGMNLGRKYRYEWHDLMAEVHGPVVASFEQGFRRHWAHAGLLGDLAYAAALLDGPSKAGPAPACPPGSWIQVRCLPTETAWKPFASAVLESLRQARNCIYLENPYLFDKRVIAGLVRARRRGVDVRVILPRVNDLKAGSRSNLVKANYLLQQGVRVYFYPGMTHVKALLVDGWSCLGSGNLNHLSLCLNREQNIATSDPAFAACLKGELFDEDFARSIELKEPISLEWIDAVADLVLENF
ncbi:MAG TPA: phosphatidylserine/phosphatidylglycerophosphate/cardiolipin synthase family protein [Dongiaceae bacterium]|nr:phosphatidylserine/phosphatidylglycerophosphate/cardiolipin synthase family protein [Dongiaceae bacterium]